MREVTNNELYEILGDMMLLADRYFRTSMGALEFREMNEEAKIEHFNNCIIPIFEATGCPVKGYGRYLEFQDAVREMWD